MTYWLGFLNDDDDNDSSFEPDLSCLDNDDDSNWALLVSAPMMMIVLVLSNHDRPPCPDDDEKSINRSLPAPINDGSDRITVGTIASSGAVTVRVKLAVDGQLLSYVVHSGLIKGAVDMNDILSLT